MELAGKTFALEMEPIFPAIGPGLDAAYFVTEFRHSLCDELIDSGLRLVATQGAETDVKIRASVVSLDPGDRWTRRYFAPFAGAARAFVQVEVGDGRSVWGRIEAEGARRMAWLEPNDDSVSMLASAAGLAGKHAARKVVAALRKR